RVVSCTTVACATLYASVCPGCHLNRRAGALAGGCERPRPTAAATPSSTTANRRDMADPPCARSTRGDSRRRGRGEGRFSEPLAAAPRPWLGGALLVVILAMRAVAGSLLFHQLDAASFLLALVALALAGGGIPLLKRTGPAILFLVFMVPLPYELERNVGQP